MGADGVAVTLTSRSRPQRGNQLGCQVGETGSKSMPRRVCYWRAGKRNASAAHRQLVVRAREEGHCMLGERLAGPRPAWQFSQAGAPGPQSEQLLGRQVRGARSGPSPIHTEPQCRRAGAIRLAQQSWGSACSTHRSPPDLSSVGPWLSTGSTAAPWTSGELGKHRTHSGAIHNGPQTASSGGRLYPSMPANPDPSHN